MENAAKIISKERLYEQVWGEYSCICDNISAPEAAKKWGISERRVQKLCEENRIPGIAKFSRMWLIPKDAEKPIDKRKKQKDGADYEQ